jgi:ubiquinone/menaquinone biosynthesis C-methylase UbiE
MSRLAAFDFVIPRIKPGSRVLDVGAGASPLAGILAKKLGCQVLAIDHDKERLTEAWEGAGRTYEVRVGDLEDLRLSSAQFDHAIAVYCLQHLIGYEPLVWVRIRHGLKPGGTLIATGRYRTASPQYEGARGDPLMSYDEFTIRTLAKLTAFDMVSLQRYRYEAENYEPVDDESANMIGFELRAVNR